MENLETRYLKALEEGIQTAVDKAAEKLRDELRPAQDTGALNEKVAEVVAKVVESQLEGLTKKARQLAQPRNSTTTNPTGPGSSGKGK